MISVSVYAPSPRSSSSWFTIVRQSLPCCPRLPCCPPLLGCEGATALSLDTVCGRPSSSASATVTLAPCLALTPLLLFSLIIPPRSVTSPPKMNNPVFAVLADHAVYQLHRQRAGWRGRCRAKSATYGVLSVGVSQLTLIAPSAARPSAATRRPSAPTAATTSSCRAPAAARAGK